ncbi:MAG: hypothetical protein KIG32_06410, partial [Ruminiclostridium sp.]|nr:hypothetical protein [Ruminiclostridium sp.]
PIGARGDSPRSTAPSRGEGVGVRDREIALLIKKIDFFDKLDREFLIPCFFVHICQFISELFIYFLSHSILQYTVHCDKIESQKAE